MPSPEQQTSCNPDSADDSIAETEEPRRYLVNLGDNSDVNREASRCGERPPPGDDEAESEADE